MANDLVVQLGAKLDNFQSDMNKAGGIADDAVSNIESKFANLNPNLGSFVSIVAGAFAGVLGSVGALLALLKSVNGELADIGRNAEFVGVSVEKFQELKFAATQQGVGGDQAVTDLRKVAALLADAKQNENSLTKLLETNNVKFRDRNGEIVKTDEFLKIAAATIGRFESFPEKVKAAEMLGLSEAWVKALRDNGREFQNIASSAEAAGVVIDKSTIAKAERFDAEWRKSSGLWAAQMKSAIADVASFLDGLIDKASSFIEEFNKSRGITSESGQTRFNELADQLQIAANDALGLAQNLEQMDRVIASIKAKGGQPELVAGLEAVRDKAKEAGAELTTAAAKAAALLSATSSANFPGGVPLPGARPAGASRPDPNAFKLPSRGTEEVDSFDRESERIQRHIEQIKADTIATFANSSVQAQLRTEFQLLNAIRKDEGEVTQEQIDKYTELRATMTQQEALTAAGITLTNEHAESFKRLTIAVGTVTTEQTKATSSLQKINSASQQVGSALSTAFADAIVEGKSLNDVLASLLKTLEKAIINAAFADIFSPQGGAKTSLFGSLFTGHAAGTNYAPGGWSWVGEQGPELMRLPRGSQVMPNEVATGLGGGGSQIVFSPTIDARGADVAAVAKLAKIMSDQRRTFTRDVINAVIVARKGRHL